MDRPVGVGRVGDVTDRPDFRSENRNWSVGRWSGKWSVGGRVLVGRWSGFGRFYKRILRNSAFLNVPEKNLASLSFIFTSVLNS